jgi:hypothetical protein
MVERWVFDQRRGVMKLETTESFVDSAVSLCRAALHQYTRHDIVASVEDVFQEIEFYATLLQVRQQLGLVTVRQDQSDRSLELTPTAKGNDELRKWRYICAHSGVTRTMASSEQIAVC